MIIENRFIKDTDESYTIGVDFTNREPILSGATLSSATVDAIEEKNETDYSSGGDAVIASTVGTIDGNKAKVRVQNGEAGRDYIISFTCTFDNSDILQEQVLMKVRDR